MDYEKNNGPKRAGKQEQPRKFLHLPGLIISGVLLAIVIVFDVLLFRSQMLPSQFLIPIVIALLVIVLIAAVLMWDRTKIRFFVGVVLSVLFGALLIYGSHALMKTVGTLQSITEPKTEITQVGFYVAADDPAQSLQDAAGYTFGIMAELDRENTDRAVEQVEEELGGQIQTAEYAGATELIDALREQSVGAVALNVAYLDMLEEIEGYENVASEIREITVSHVETVVENEAEQPADTTSELDSVLEDGVFTVFISGIDTRGELTAKSRSDVNIIATVNTNTHQVLLVSTPRDYYVPLSISNGVPDKLTHAGIYGVNVCVETLEMLYDIDIDYYFRVNFIGFKDIINSLGGVTVYSDYSFTTSGYSFQAGWNTVNGEQALAFARERYAFAEGDRQRGKNQMEVIKAVIDKAISPELLVNYASVLSAVEGSFETSVPYDLIAALVRDQLSSGESWNVVSYSVDGTGASKKPYSMSQNAYVMIPDESTVSTARELMEQVRSGEVVTAP